MSINLNENELKELVEALDKFTEERLNAFEKVADQVYPRIQSVKERIDALESRASEEFSRLKRNGVSSPEAHRRADDSCGLTPLWTEFHRLQGDLFSKRDEAHDAVSFCNRVQAVADWDNWQSIAERKLRKLATIYRRIGEYDMASAYEADATMLHKYKDGWSIDEDDWKELATVTGSAHIAGKCEGNAKEALYQRLRAAKNNNPDQEKILELIEGFQKLGDFKDAAALGKECFDLAAKRQYDFLIQFKRELDSNRSASPEEYRKIAWAFRGAKHKDGTYYADVEKLANQCEDKAREIEERQKEQEKIERERREKQERIERERREEEEQVERERQRQAIAAEKRRKFVRIAIVATTVIVLIGIGIGIGYGCTTLPCGINPFFLGVPLPFERLLLPFSAQPNFEILFGETLCIQNEQLTVHAQRVGMTLDSDPPLTNISTLIALGVKNGSVAPVIMTSTVGSWRRVVG